MSHSLRYNTPHKNNIFYTQHGLCVGMYMGQVERIFLTQPIMVGKKKFNPTQPYPSHKSNPTHMGRVESMGLTNFYYYYY